jgi:hypothetical protein
MLASFFTATPSPALIEDNGATLVLDVSTHDDPSIVSPAPSLCPPSTKMEPPSPTPSLDLTAISQQLRSLAQVVQGMSPPPLAIAPPNSLLPTEAAPSSDAIPLENLLSTMSHDKVIKHLHHKGTVLPSICPCDTANSSDTKTHWTAEELHRVMGCRKFRNYKHLLQVSRNREWVDSGKFAPSLDSFATVPKGNRGKTLDRTHYCYLDVVHVDIAFGDCLSVEGFHYVLVLVDRATCYNWTIGLKDVSSTSILNVLRLFHAAAGSLARCFYCNCDLKLFGSAIQEYLTNANSKIVAAPAKQQSANGLVESYWKIMVHMGCAYLTVKQMPQTYWFYAITHAARMMNAIPGKIHGCLASPFLLAHGIGHDERTWIPLFSLRFFHNDKDGPAKCSKHQAHTMDGIVIGCSPTSNALLVYNPHNKQYYEPDCYCINPYRLPSSVYQDIKYDGGLFCTLLCDDNPPMEEKYPPGTQVERVDPLTKMLVAGTVMDIPFSVDISAPDTDLSYTILFCNGSTSLVPLSEMADIIPSPLVHDINDVDSNFLLPPLLQLNSKIAYEHDGQYHKGFLGIRDGIHCFMFKFHVNKCKEDWGVPLPNLP